MEPKCYKQTPLIILFFLFCLNSSQVVCMPRNLNLRYLTVLSPSPNSPPNSQSGPPPTKPPAGQFFSSLRPTGPPPRATSAPQLSLQPPPNAPSSPSNSISAPPSPSSFFRSPFVFPKNNPRGNFMTQPFFPKPLPSSFPTNQAIQQICKSTDYPEICISSLTPFLLAAPKTDPVSVLEMSIKACTSHAKVSLAAASKLVTFPNYAAGGEMAAALSDCKDMYSDALDGLQSAMDAIQSRDIGTINSMLSGVVTDAVTCGDGFDGTHYPLVDYDDKLHKMASNCLALASLVK